MTVINVWFGRIRERFATYRACTPLCIFQVGVSLKGETKPFQPSLPAMVREVLTVGVVALTSRLPPLLPVLVPICLLIGSVSLGVRSSIRSDSRIDLFSIGAVVSTLAIYVLRIS